MLNAGRDLNVRTNTIDTVGLSGVRTSLDSIASVTGGTVTMAAGRDLTIAGATINASGDLVLGANRTVTIGTVQSSAATNLNVSGHINTQSLQNNGSQLTAGGNVTIAAARTEAADLTITGSRVNAGNNLTATGSNVNIVSAVDAASTDMHTLLKHGTNSLIQTSEVNVASGLSAGNNLSIAALGINGGTGGTNSTGNLTVKGSDLTTDKGVITLAATGNINVLEQQLNQRKYTAGTYDGGTLLSTVTNKGSNDVRITQGAGSTISGDSVQLGSGRDVLIQGSSVVGTNDVNIAARNNITIAPSQTTKSQTAAFEEHASGLFSNGGASITLGVKDLKNNSLDTSVANNGSTVGSVTGNINISAGNVYTQTGSELVTPAGNITVAAKKVDIVSATDTGSGSREEHTAQSGLTLAISNPVLDAMLSAANTLDTMDQAKDPRMKALAAATTVLAGRSAIEALTKDPTAAANVTISLTVGSSKSDSKQTQSSSTAIGSTVNAGGNVDIRAAGDGAGSTVTVLGSDINAGGNATLKADGALILQAAQNTATQQSTTSSDSAALGVAITTGPSGTSYGFTASASTARGNSDGKDVYWTNTHVNAGNQVSLMSGTDTTLKGAVVSANQVVTNVAGNLNIESLQDASVYKSKDQNAGGSITVGVGFTGSANIGSSKVNGDYVNVAEQSGIKSGNGGYQVNVTGNTDLKGGVIASTQGAVDSGKNTLTTATLTQNDLQNRSVFDASGFSIGGSVGKETTKAGGVKTFDGGMNGVSAGIGSSSGNTTSITKSGISGGAIAITDEANQIASTGKDGAQTVASIDRTVTSATGSNGIGKDWDGQSLKDTVTSQAQITAAFGQSASKAVGEYASSKLDLANEKLINANDKTNNLTDAQRIALSQEAVKLIDDWKDGGAARVALHTAVGALTGNLQGAAGAFTSATAMPYIGAAIERMDLPDGVKAGMTIIASSALGSAVGGLAGVAASVNVDENNRRLHGEEARLATLLAKMSAGTYTEAEILNALRYSGIKGNDGKVIVPEGTQEQYISKGGTFVNVATGTTIQDTWKTDKTIVLRPPDGSQIVLLEDAPTPPSNDLIKFILGATTPVGGTSPYILSKAPNVTTTSSLPPAPDNTTRVPMIVGDAVYFPLRGNCPAASCTNGDPIAYAYAKTDAPTRDYIEAEIRNTDRNVTIVTSLFSGVGSAVRAVATIGDIISTAITASRVSTAVSTATKVGAVLDDAARPLSFTPKGSGTVGEITSAQTGQIVDTGLPVWTPPMPSIGANSGRSLAYENPSQLVQSRVDDLVSQIPPNSKGRITMGVAVVEDANGVRSTLISTSEPRGYLRPGVTTNPGEIVVSGTGHAEADIVSYANANGLKIIDIGATRPVCASCQNVIGPTGANVTTPSKPLPKGTQ